MEKNQVEFISREDLSNLTTWGEEIVTGILTANI